MAMKFVVGIVSMAGHKKTVSMMETMNGTCVRKRDVGGCHDQHGDEEG